VVQRCRVLIVDDQEIFVASVRALLDADDKVEVVGSAWNGAEALTLTAELLPDVVLMDIDMPVMDGVEATRQILARFSAIHVLIVSGLHEPDRIEAALHAGASAHLAKNRIKEELVETILSIGRSHTAGKSE
jgi:DNA-binding NarL/FixJ family response regulator